MYKYSHNSFFKLEKHAYFTANYIDFDVYYVDSKWTISSKVSLLFLSLLIKFILSKDLLK